LPDSAYVDVRTVAQLYQISVATVWRWAASGILPAPVKVGPGTTRWSVAALRQHRSTLARWDRQRKV